MSRAQLGCWVVGPQDIPKWCPRNTATAQYEAHEARVTDVDAYRSTASSRRLSAGDRKTHNGITLPQEPRPKKPARARCVLWVRRLDRLLAVRSTCTWFMGCCPKSRYVCRAGRARCSVDMRDGAFGFRRVSGHEPGVKRDVRGIGRRFVERLARHPGLAVARGRQWRRPCGPVDGDLRRTPRRTPTPRPRPVTIAVAGAVYQLSGDVQSTLAGQSVCLVLKELTAGTSTAVGSAQACLHADRRVADFPDGDLHGQDLGGRPR